MAVIYGFVDKYLLLVEFWLFYFIKMQPYIEVVYLCVFMPVMQNTRDLKQWGHVEVSALK